MQALLLLIGFGGGALVCWIILNKRNSRNLMRMEGSQQALSQLESHLNTRNLELRREVQEKNHLKSQLSPLQSQFEMVSWEQEKLHSQVSELEGRLAVINAEREQFTRIHRNWQKFKLN